MNLNRSFKFAIFLAFLTLITALFSLCIGRFSVNLIDVFNSLLKLLGFESEVAQNIYNVIVQIRLPRIIAAMLVGAALGVSGAAYQGIFCNQLVSPDLLGVSSGACVGASCAIILDFSIFGVQIFAFICGLIAVGLTLSIPRLIQRNNTLILVLSGVIVSGLMLSIIGFLKYIADPETKLPDIVYWQLGSLAKIDIVNIKFLAPMMLICMILLVALSWRINILSLGDDSATRLGVNVNLERNIIIICSTFLTASSVCISGIIAWIGLLIPHLARMLIGANNTHVIPASIFMSAIFLIIVDTIARTISISEIPLGVLTGFIGTTFFIWVLTKNKKFI